MTVQEAEKAGMSDIDIALGIVTGPGSGSWKNRKDKV